MDDSEDLECSSSQGAPDEEEREKAFGESSRTSCCSRLITMLQLIAAAILYTYVFFKVVFTLVVPGSVNPLLYHPVSSEDNQRNDSNVSEGMENLPVLNRKASGHVLNTTRYPFPDHSETVGASHCVERWTVVTVFYSAHADGTL